MFFRVEELLELWMGVEENCLLFLFRAIAADIVACRKNKQVSDAAVALCPREDAASSLFVFAVYDAFRHVVFGTYTIVVGTNPTRYHEIV